MIVIMGPGRCGTSFLIELLRNLGYDNGGHIEIFREVPRAQLTAEYPWPQVIKGTGTLCHGFDRWRRTCGWDVEHVFFCWRNHEGNLKSMIKKKKGKRQYKGLTDEELYAKLDWEIKDSYSRGKFELLKSDVSWSKLEFPVAAQDLQYCYLALEPFVKVPEYEKFTRIWEETVQPDKIRNG